MKKLLKQFLEYAKANNELLAAIALKQGVEIEELSTKSIPGGGIKRPKD